MPETQPIETIRAQIGVGLDAMQRAIPAPTSQTSAIVRSASSTVKNVRSIWAAVDKALTNAAGEIGMLWTDSRLAPNAQQAEATSIVNDVRNQTDNGMAQITDALNALAVTLRQAARPPRPGNDAATEARLAGIKSDLVMLLGGSMTGAVAHDLIDELQRYEAAGDDLAVWLLASSDWPDKYLRSRGLDSISYSSMLSNALAATAEDSGTTRVALDLLHMIESRDGMLRATVAMRAAIRMALDDLRQA